MTELTERTLHNEWEREDELERIFGIKPYERWGPTIRYIIDDNSGVEIGVCHRFIEPFVSEPYFVIHRYKCEWMGDRYYRLDKGNKYYSADTFEEVIEIFHKWFRKLKEDEQLELF
ncbi:MAG: hypothetical protein IKO38_07245 [Erysipelotrichaceae bacterium]|nr:hypothetical protein [Erysipelotrichaceae bacterium]